MILCPNCRHLEIEGALFCSECGYQLAMGLIATSLVNSAPEEERSISPVDIEPAQVDQSTSDTAMSITLQLVDTGAVIPLTGRTEYSLGRITEGQLILPDIDLSQYDAYAQGVSRLHAVLKFNGQKLFIVDLESSNGTRVNGQKITSNVDYPLNHGDVFALGKLKIQILIHR